MKSEVAAILGVLKMEIFEKISRLIQSKDFSKAKELAQNIPDEIDKNNTLGVISFYEEKNDDAINFFEKALRINPAHSDVLFNYSKALFEKQNYFESWRYLTRIPKKTWEIYDMLGDTQLKQDNPAMALHYYKKAYEMSSIKELKEKYDSIKEQHFKNEKLAIFCLPNIDNFIKDIAEILSNIYKVKLVVTTDSKQIVEAYNWADIIWLEWANEMAVQITGRMNKAGKRVICRLHSYEALSTYPEKMNWQNVDILILVAEHMREILEIYHNDTYRKISNMIRIIPNGIDLNKFVFKNRTPGFDIAVVAHISHKKDPAAWLQVAGMLKKIDRRYVLHIAGEFQELRYANYFRHFIEDADLERNIKLYGFVKDINAFLENKNYLLSTSIHESFGYNIAEAMARGIKPIIHNYSGSKEQWPAELVYSFIDEIPAMLENEYSSEKYRSFVENKFSIEKQIKNIVEVLNLLRCTQSKVNNEQMLYGSSKFTANYCNLKGVFSESFVSKCYETIDSYNQKNRDNLDNSTKVVVDTTIRKPLVSVVTPAYNAAEFLEALANSLSKQSIFRDLQWVIVDDDSKDDTQQSIAKLCKQYKDMSIKVLKNEKNAGAAYSLEKGFEHANGEYVAWVSADDYYIDDRKLEKDVNLLENSFDVVFSKYSLFGSSPGNAKRYETILPDNSTELFIRITLSNNLNGSSVVMKKELYDRAGGFDKMLWNVDGDYDLFSKLILCGAKIGLSESTVFNRTHSGQTSSRSILMKVGSSLTRSRFFRIDHLRTLIKDKIFGAGNERIMYSLSIRFPLFFLDLYRESIQIPDFERSSIKNLIEHYNKLVDFLFSSEAFKVFLCNYTMKEEKL